MATEIDRFPVKDLPNRYNINRSVLYTRLQKLDIQTTKVGNKSYVDGESLKLLDDLDQHLKNGGTTTEFIPKTTVQTDRQDNSSKMPDSKALNNQTDTLDRQERQAQQLEIPGLLQELVEYTLEVVENRRSELNDLRDLEEIANNKWLIPTKKLAEIIGRSRSYFTGKKTINYCGFVFSKIGKQGNESLWRVSKDSK